MRHIVMKRIAVAVLLTFFSMIIIPHYSFAKEEITELKYAKKFYNQGNYDDADEMLTDFIKKYGGKEEYKSKLCEAYYLKAKIYFAYKEHNDLIEALRNLYKTDIHYKLQSDEKIQFIELAEKIKREEEEKGFKITIQVSDPPGPLFICIDKPDPEQAEPLKQNKIVLNLTRGPHVFYLISREKGQYVIKRRNITKDIEYEFVFSNGKDINDLLPPGKKVIEQPSQKPKKRKSTLLLVVGTAAAISIIAILLSSKKKKDEGAAPGANKFTLKVRKGPGVDGTPETGTTTHDVGEEVPYSYSLKHGYKHLVVKIDGKKDSASGTITMDKDHELTASATVDSPQ
jgi:tetratricopeptide (TPR) repeat protein